MKKTILTLITHCAIIYSACSQTNYIVPTASSGTIYQDPTSSNIGIGTATPAYPLDVSGNANVSGTLSAAAFQLAAGAGAGYLLTSDSSGNAGWAPPAAGTGWALISPDILNTNSGGIGIGVSLADSFFSSPLPFVFGVSNERYSGSGIPPFLAMIDNQVDTGTGGGLPGASAFSFLVLRSFAGNPNGDPAVDFVVNNTGMVGVGGLPDIADNGVLNANFFVSAYDTLKALMGVVTYAGMPALVVATNGNVGIGTATPAAALDVSGNAHVSGTLAAGSIQLTGGTPIAGYLVQTDGTGHLSFTPPPTGSCATCVWAYATDGTDIYNTNPGLVGVGTYAPTSTLTVSAGILSTSSGTTPSSVIEINNNSAHESIGDELIFLETNVANSLIVKRNSTTESTSGPGGTTATTTDFVVTSSGFTGIGTATPQSALDVSGGISLGTYAGTIAAPANGMIVSGILGVGTSTPAYKLDVTGDARITANTIIEGSLGIGTTAPAYNLDVNGNARVSTILNVGTNVGQINMTSPGLGPGSSGIYMLVSDPTVKAIHVQQQNQIGGTPYPYTDKFVVYADGRTAIGDFTGVTNPLPSGYNLYVTQGILAEKYKCALSSDNVNWTDYVFDKDYKLRDLTDVESYVKANHHLPDVPSSEEVYCDGLDMAQMDATLLKKIEELTLYVLDLKKANDAMKAQISNLKK